MKGSSMNDINIKILQNEIRGDISLLNNLETLMEDPNTAPDRIPVYRASYGRVLEKIQEKRFKLDELRG